MALVPTSPFINQQQHGVISYHQTLNHDNYNTNFVNPQLSDINVGGHHWQLWLPQQSSSRYTFSNHGPNTQHFYLAQTEQSETFTRRRGGGDLNRESDNSPAKLKGI